MEAINKAFGYISREANAPMERIEWQIDKLDSDQVLVEVAGCGLCHTDITFFTGAVKTKESQVILGHEISGRVVAAGTDFQDLINKNVVIPAVLPCGECELCKKGRDNICQQQKMPGNDFYGGFASHITVPGKFLCTLPDDLGDFELWQFSVVADAITTPYQSLKRSNLQSGDLAIVIGVGGIGIYMVQHAKNAGATVIAIDIDDKKLEHSKTMGASYVFNSSSLAPWELKKQVRTLVKEQKLPTNSWRVFETSGSGAGQTTAFNLLSFAGSVGVIGFTMEKLNLRLSNVMAFDADIFGNWGCRPAYYSDVVQDILDGKINLIDNIEEHPLESINEVLKLALEHKLEKRVIFRP